MTTGRIKAGRTILATALLLASGTSLAESPQAAVDAGWILERIARPAPSSTGFVELRGSKLLKQPLRIVGEYRHPDANTLVREVRAPYAETTTIRAGEAVIERAGADGGGFGVRRAHFAHQGRGVGAPVRAADAQRGLEQARIAQFDERRVAGRGPRQLRQDPVRGNIPG